MQINENGLIEVSKYLGVNTNQLAIEMRNAPHAEKTHMGNAYPSGTGRASERAFLYALVRLLRPVNILEIGTGWGAMTTQLLSASDNKVVSVDIVKDRWGKPVGSLVPSQYRSRLTQGLVGFTQLPLPVDFCLEDSAHTYDSTKSAWNGMINPLAPNGVIISHDACNKPDVLRAIRDCGIEPLIIQLEDNAPGFALWQKQTTSIQSTVKPLSEVSVKPSTSRRKRRANKTAS